MQKALLLLEGGLALTFSGRPGASAKVVEGIAAEWHKINRRALSEAIRVLYESKLIDYREKSDGTVSVAITQAGHTKHLMYNWDAIKIKMPSRWDHLWRMVIFDIPESKKRARDALAQKLSALGFYPMQKSVFIHPYPCWDEVDFLIEHFDVRPFVRMVLVKETDIDLHLRDIFKV